MKKLTYSYIYWLLSAAIIILLHSCADDELAGYEYVISGEDVTVSVGVAMPEPDNRTRASLSDVQLDEVRTLWIRTYSATSGKPTSDWTEFKPNTTDHENKIHSYNIKTKSGNSYIVAVANVDNLGVAKDAPTVQRPLKELLMAADTWEKFLNIAAATPSSQSEINAAPVPVTMSGCFVPSNVQTHPKLQEWGETLNFTPVFIPASTETNYKMQGVIHLRRLVSHVTFNIRAGNDVDIQPVSYRVENVPKTTWLYERAGDKANFGDYSDYDTKNNYYASSDDFTSQYIKETTEGGKEVFKFDFWLGENKHSALSEAALSALGITFNNGTTAEEIRQNYAHREREQKTDDGLNTGLYTCLTGNTWTPANMATYVVVRCNVAYKAGADYEGKHEGAEDRIGNAEYIVHLGFLDNNPSDFNCYRNVNYTYNMIVNGLNDIYVEAVKDKENYPGASGLVSDVENATINIDAHYAAFNIELSEAELRGTASSNLDGLGFIISVWDQGREVLVTDSHDFSEIDGKFMNWVELRPANSKSELALYYPRNGTDEGKKTFTLMDASKARNWPADDPRISKSGVYTVFVNEYVYEDDSDEYDWKDGKPSWVSYVNQNPRRFYVRVTKNVSADGESVFASSKYAISQSSIMTYYSRQNFTPAVSNATEGIASSAGSALGVERVNETLGLNLRSSYRSSYDGMSDKNGRYNVWQWLTHKDKDLKWNTFVKQTVPTYIPTVNNLQNGSAIPEGIMRLPAPVDYNGTYDECNARSQYDPQPNSYNDSDYIEAINACMNRNRDNNGNGVIDASELRWYVPASGKYLRMILGSDAMTSPLFNYNEMVGKKLPSSNNGQNTRYLYFASEGKVIWTMEGMSMSDVGQWGISFPWQIRCVRNLGSHLENISDMDKITQAYVHEPSKHVVRMAYYDDAAVRSETYSGNGAGTNMMPVHMDNSEFNMPFKAFQYATISEMNAAGISRRASSNQGSNYLILSQVSDKIMSNPCSPLNKANSTGWRVPNQKELAIMRNLNIFSDMSGKEYIASCTVSFFDLDNNGGQYRYANNQFMGIRKDAATRIPLNDNQSIYINCIRDYTDN